MGKVVSLEIDTNPERSHPLRSTKNLLWRHHTPMIPGNRRKIAEECQSSLSGTLEKSSLNKLFGVPWQQTAENKKVKVNDIQVLARKTIRHKLIINEPRNPSHQEAKNKIRLVFSRRFCRCSSWPFFRSSTTVSLTIPHQSVMCVLAVMGASAIPTEESVTLHNR